MHFGKQLAAIVAMSDAEWTPFWISYKALKKRIKDLQRGGGCAESDEEKARAASSGGGQYSSPPTPEDLSCRVGEVAFFKTIRAEIAKATEFFLDMEAQMGARERRIRQGIQYLKNPLTVLEDDAWTRMRRACVALYRDLLLLEHFAVMNYCACAKALKKHDKTVRLELRGRFMRGVVHSQPFTHYPRLLGMLQGMEQTFEEINVFQGESARRLGAEERLFLDAIRGLNQQATRMQREERANAGVVSARAAAAVAALPSGAAGEEEGGTAAGRD